MKIAFGPASIGSILTAEKTLENLKKLNLLAAEVAFTHAVYIKSNKTAKKIGDKAKELGISLSIHAPYYINLASKEKPKITASKKRILLSCERAHYLGASPVIFHAAYYQERNPELVYQMVKKAIIDLQKQIKKNKWKVKLAPEVTGKQSQFGSLDELLRLRKETGCEICIDFAHLYARNQGKIDYNEIFKKIKSFSHIHAHFSGITFTTKGERSHQTLDKRHFNPLAKAIKKTKPKSIIIINESPDTLRDAVKMRKWFK